MASKWEAQQSSLAGGALRGSCPVLGAVLGAESLVAHSQAAFPFG